MFLSAIEDSDFLVSLVRFSTEPFFAKKMELGMEITLSRKPGRQANRENYPASEGVNYYRQAISIPLIEYVTEDLRSRLSNDSSTVQLFNSLPKSDAR